MRRAGRNRGFTLIELAVVLVIVSVILSGFLSAMSSRVDQSKYRKTRHQIDDIRQAILGFAASNGRLPCPARATDGGQEAPAGGGVCTYQHGFVPGRTLGLSGRYNRDNLLLDSWNNPIRYSVASDSNFTTAGGMRAATMSGLNPDLVVCTAVSDSDTGCSGSGSVQLIDNAVFVLLSLGADGAAFVDTPFEVTDQGENSSEVAVAANAAGENIAYLVAADPVFVSREYRDRGVASERFNDIIVWLSPYLFYKQMIDTGQLP